VTKLGLMLDLAGFLLFLSTSGETELHDFWPVQSINTVLYVDTQGG